ncbi:MAG: transaldolase [Anaerolineaceae bacterium]|jgi:transaldolase|nr:transaldolase [Anaerolineaceae bacterium]
MKPLSELKIKIFADGAVISEMVEMYRNPLIKGFTTNPTLMHKAGINDYKAFALEAVKAIPDRPISLEVFSDEMEEMRRQALLIRDWGENVYVKIPVTNTKGESTTDIAHDLSFAGVKLNITAMMTFGQVLSMSNAIAGGAPSYLSVFAGRIADTGRDPLPVMISCVELLKTQPTQELIWASPRELLNVFQADEIGCHIITVTVDILRKLNQTGKDLNEFSLDTVKMFREDAQKAGYQL